VAYQIVKRVLESSVSKGSDRLVLIAIAERANARSATAWPSVADIATYANLSRRAVQTAIRNLEAYGELNIAGREGTSHYYTVTVADHHGAKGAHTSARVGAHTSARGGADLCTWGAKTSAHEPSKNRLENHHDEPPVPLAAPLRHEILEGVERVLALEGNRLRGKQKRYRCKLTREDVIWVVDKALEEKSVDLVDQALDAFVFYTDYPGFTSPRQFAQKLALLKWIRKQKPPLMEEVESLLARIGPSKAKDLIRVARDGRETLEYITSEQLNTLHGLLKEAVA
jgi:hypothetical protein